jgi:hypothetical protein
MPIVQMRVAVVDFVVAIVDSFKVDLKSSFFIFDVTLA